MRYLLAIPLSLFSGFLIYMEISMVLHTFSHGIVISLIFGFLGGTVLTLVLMLKGAKTASKVMTRASLIGALIWLMMIPAGMILAGSAVVETNAVTEAEQAGAVLGGGLFAVLTGGLAVAMIFVCLLTFVIFYFIGREMKPEQQVQNIENVT
jgi:hypothetical protein